MNAKSVSKKTMIIAVIWIVILSLIKGFWPFFGISTPFGLSMNEIITSGIAIAGIFTPVYLSIIMDKIKDIKIGGSE